MEPECQKWWETDIRSPVDGVRNAELYVVAGCGGPGSHVSLSCCTGTRGGGELLPHLLGKARSRCGWLRRRDGRYSWEK